MATLAQLVDRVEEVIQRTYNGSVEAKINEGLDICASEVLLPALESEGTVTTNSTGIVDIPEDWSYDRGLYMCTFGEGSIVKVVDSVSLLEKEHPGFRTELKAGDVKTCTVRAGQLIYYPIPAEATILTCGFYEKHTELSGLTDVPDILPKHLHYKLLCSFAAKEIFDIIEDGIDGAKVNTAIYSNKFKAALDELKEYHQIGKSVKPATRTKSWI